MPTTYADDEEVTTSAASTNDDNLEVEFGDEKVLSGTGLQKILPEKGKVARFNLLTDLVKPKMAWAHFVEGKGSFRCISKRDDKGNILGTPAICCKKTANNQKEQAQLIFGVLAFHYLNASPKDGKYKTKEDPIDWDIKWIKLSRSGFGRVSKLPEEDQTHHDIDCTVSWKAGNAVGLEYNKIASKSRFRQNPELLAEVKAAAEPYLDGKLLIARLGKKLNETELAALFAGQAAASSSDATVDDVDDI